MPMSYATITGRITQHGSDDPVVGKFVAVPQTRGLGLRTEGERLTVGAIEAVIDTAGYILDPSTGTPGVKIPLTGIEGLVWRLVVVPAGVYNENWELGSYEITADADLADDDFDPVEVVGVPSSQSVASLLAQVQAIGTTTDGVVTGLINDPDSDAAAALSASTVHQSHAVEGTAKRVFSITPVTADAAQFQVDYNSYPNTGAGTGTTNHGTFLGYNVGRHSNGSVDADDDSLIMGFEQNYFDSPGSGQFGPEWYVEFWSADGYWEMFRPFYTRIEVDPDDSEVINAATHFDIGNGPDGGFTVLSDFGHNTPADAKIFEITNTEATFYTNLSVTGLVQVGTFGPILANRQISDGASTAVMDFGAHNWPTANPATGPTGVGFESGGGVRVSAAGTLYTGTGVPTFTPNANGDIYIRLDGGAGSTIYQRRAGAWVATAA